MFHWVKGVPFDFNSGAYDGLTLWEQIDNGAQFTPAKKYLTALPIGLYVSKLNILILLSLNLNLLIFSSLDFYLVHIIHIMMQLLFWSILHFWQW